MIKWKSGKIEFLVDTGASATVVGEDDVKAVRAGEVNRDRHYKLADGSQIPHKGDKTFRAVMESGHMRQLTTFVTNVDQPLMSVNQVLHGGGRVVF